ncbi:hypothetical protein BSO35_01305 [Campylobacter jejuni]|nr:hypothetical protein [Campylobacter jejuni]EAL6759001.1 hypothetical protein [Campylobacter jejuni]
MSKIIPFREEIFHQINQILESQKAFIFLWGKSGSGKSVLLQSVGGKIKCRKRKIKCRIFATNYLSFNLKLKL